MKRWALKSLALASLALAAAAAAGCGSTSDTSLRDSLKALGTPTAVTTTPPKKSSTEPNCGDPTRSLRPLGALPAPGRMPAGSFMRRIQERGRLIAGVDQNTLLFGYLDPFTGRFRGLEVDLLRQIAKAIFGDPNAIEFKAMLTSTQRTDYPKEGKVDVVADAVTMNCSRWQDVSFSTAYYDAKQRVLVPTSSKARDAQHLRGLRVCARAGTTTLTNLQKQPSHPTVIGLPERTDCLVALQQGRVDAISADDAILRGFQEQDPYTKLLPGSLEPEPYGMTIAKSHPDFVRFVNGVLARMRTDGSLAALYHKWLGASAPTVPRAKYKD